MKHWTKGEIDILKQHYGKISPGKLKNLLPNRSWRAISDKASRVKTRRSINSFLRPQRVGKISNNNLLYLAGLFDGEGSFGINWKRGRIYGFEPCVKITTTCKQLMEWVGEELNCHVKRKNIGLEEKPRKWKPAYEVKLARILDIKAFLEQIIPHLKAKKRQAELLLEFCNAQLDRKWAMQDPRIIEIFEEVKHLNTKGVHKE